MLGAGAGGETRDQLLSALVDLSDVKGSLYSVYEIKYCLETAS